MEWMCLECYSWASDTVCSECLTPAPEWAREEIIKSWDNWMLEEEKVPYEERQVRWYRLKMTGKR